MGIFDALSTSVAGLQAQSFALQNISGNIANSQTTAFKGTNTSFVDLIPEQDPAHQVAGSVAAFSRATTTVQGGIQTSSISTFMAINGQGFFVVQKPSSFADGKPVFAGTDLYSRRGDFSQNKDGYLVNGAGYYLMGIPIDTVTGNLVGSVPELLKFQNDFLPAQATSEVDYRANLASYPLTSAHNAAIPGSELINPIDFSANPLAVPPQAAKITGFGATLQPDAPAVVTGTLPLPGGTGMVNAGTFTVNGATVTITAGMTPTQVRNAINTAAPPGATASLDASNDIVLTSANADTAITIGGSATALFAEMGINAGTTNPTNLLTQNAAATGQTMTITVSGNPPLTVTFGPGAGQVSTLAELNTALATLTGGSASVNTANGNITITGAGNSTVTVGGNANPLTFGIHTTQGLPSNQTVIANDVTAFLRESVSGGAVTAFDVSGASANVQLRWAKVDSATLGAGHTDSWNLFYQTSSTATGTQPAWQNVGTNFTFSPNGQLTPAIGSLALNNVSVDGIALGNISLVFGTGGLTQFADPNGTVQVNLLQQNGFPAGQLQTVAVSNKGRIVGTYSNGRTIDLAEITLVSFNGANSLQRLDGGAYAVTDDSGAPILGASGKITGSSLEGSNTDIADEFTKLIITQQAYSANTRVISTSNTMVQDLLNMLR